MATGLWTFLRSMLRDERGFAALPGGDPDPDPPADDPAVGDADPNAPVDDPDAGGDDVETLKQQLAEAREREAEASQRLAEKDRHITRVEKEAAEARARAEATVTPPTQPDVKPPEFDEESTAIIDERTRELMSDFYMEEGAARAKAETEERRAIARAQKAASAMEKRVLDRVAPALETASQSTTAQEVADALAADPEIADIPPAVILRDITAYNAANGAGAWQSLPRAARDAGVAERAKQLQALKVELGFGTPAPPKPDAPTAGDPPAPQPAGKPPIPAATPPASPTGAVAVATRTNAARESAATQILAAFPNLATADGKPGPAVYAIVDENHATKGTYLPAE